MPLLTPAEAEAHRSTVSGWAFSAGGERIVKRWQAKHFRAAMEFVNLVAKLAEDEQHHPDIHLTSYRQLEIEIWTHAIGGLSENDFILAAKIDELPLRV